MRQDKRTQISKKESKQKAAQKNAKIKYPTKREEKK